MKNGKWVYDPKPIKQEKKKKKKIRFRSIKRSKQEIEYSGILKVFLIGQKCECKGCNNVATTVHHKKGRIGKLLCDILFFLACCMECHKKIELNPEWAKEMGYSLNRL